MKHVKYLLAFTAMLLSCAGAAAQSNPLYIQFSPSATKGALYTPDTGPVSTVAFLVMHRTSNYLSHPSTKQLPARGFTVLGMNPRFDNNPSGVLWEDVALDVRQGVRFLREQPGIEKVILIAHSGGGATMSYYQSIAENGPSVCQGENKLVQCSSEDLAGFEPSDRADGIVYLDAHPANGVNALRTLNASVIDEADAFGAGNPALDPFNPANGFNPDGDSTYSAAFIEAYSKAQSVRMNALIDKALAIRDGMDEGTHFPTDDDSFVFYRSAANLRLLSTTAHNATTQPRVLLQNDGTTSEPQIIHSVLMADPGQADADKTLADAHDLTVRSFLSSRAIRSTQSYDDVDWCSSNNSVPCSVQTISIPSLIMVAGGHYFLEDGEVIFEHMKSTDKEYVVVEGSTHGFTPCVPCETTPGQYSNVTRNTFDYIASWASARF